MQPTRLVLLEDLLRMIDVPSGLASSQQTMATPLNAAPCKKTPRCPSLIQQIRERQRGDGRAELPAMFIVPLTRRRVCRRCLCRTT